MISKAWACVCRFGGCGDNMVASSVLPLLAEKYNVEVITKRPHGEIFENNPYISKLSYKRDEDMPSNGKAWQEWFAKRAPEYEGGLFNLSHSMEYHVAFGPDTTAFYWPAAYRRKIAGRNYLEVVHDICGVAHKFEPGFFPTEKERLKASATDVIIRATSRSGKVIGWGIAGSRIDKLHPQSRSIVARLIRDEGHAVVMFGHGGKDFEVAKDIQKFVQLENGSDRGLHLALSPDDNPSWPLRRTLTQARKCDALISPDTGVAWSVSMEMMPKIILLSHASPMNITRHWFNTATLAASQERVPCWPCHRLHNDYATCTPNKDETGAACISDITIETILSALRASLGD